MDDSGTGGRAGFYAGSENDEFEIRNFTSRPRTQAKRNVKKNTADQGTNSPVISRSFGKRNKVSEF
jgi:hypothetical protein